MAELVAAPGVLDALGPPSPDRIASVSPTHLVVDNPVTGQPLRFTRLWHDSVYRGTRTWAGVLVPNGVDEVVLTFAEDGVQGSLAVAGREWTIGGTSAALVIAERLTDADEACADSAADHEPPDDSQGLAPLMSMQSDYGPYESVGMPYVDLLFVYPQSTADQCADEADLQLGIVNAVATLQNALIASEVFGRVRLVGIEKIGWTPQQVATNGKLLVNETLDELAHGPRRR